MPTSKPARLFDAHLDLAYLAECGRDMHVEPEVSRGRHTPAAVTLPSLRAGGVRACLATIFTEAVADTSAPDAETGAFAYPEGDVDAAYVAGMRQLKLYQAWRDAGLIEFLPRREHGRGSEPSDDGPLRVGVLMECADPITSPEDLEAWVEGGVVAIGMAWWPQSRYAQGNGVDPVQRTRGLTDLGRALVARMDEFGVVHDASHLSQRAVDELFERSDATVIATHSNCRALMGDQESLANQRHLSDVTIAEIARRGGVVGINLLSDFLRSGLERGRRATVEDCCAHIEHVCEVAGGRASVGFGTDMDGGFGADRLPAGIDRPSDLHRIVDALAARGWSEAELEGLRWGNWARFWGLA